MTLALALIVIGWFDVAPRSAGLPVCRVRHLSALELRRIRGVNLNHGRKPYPRAR